MVVRIRLARHGTRNNPFYHLVAIQNTKARNARPIEKLGEYDPIPRPLRQPIVSPRSEDRPGFNGQVISPGIATNIPREKRIEWNEGRIKYWLDNGAQPSKSAARLLDRAGLIPLEKRDQYKGIYPRTQSARPVLPAGVHDPHTA
ncbi:37S ribosomal protein S16, mitochondrial [Malassezia vespertilionis]|uniref:Mrps16p n=1 Tax=Malassezia vespertilionis TaxID=2020962 RepID=A0A2N1JFZ3_9BASI|nr:37S ribosomal protein S16, mitochondrial [Malassezia vespertilionis]PKI85446.1 Mrps16p [Malassezia vespertilionis]WFD05313.1 37S ribosomal protein S16, mitochondrial [Malassezia vespertilionis]